MTDPFWLAPAVLHTEALRQDTAADVCVVGGGIAGVMLAHALAAEDLNVVLLEAKALGDGETGRTSAHLSSALDDRYGRLEQLHGARGASLAYQSHRRGIERIAELAASEAIDCDFAWLDGFLLLAPGSDPEEIDRELGAARRAGFVEAERRDGVPGLRFVTGPCLRFPSQARFHPLAFVYGLQLAARRRGARIFTDSPVEEISGGPFARVTTRDGLSVTAGAVVIATNAPIHPRVGVHPKQTPYRTFALAAPVPAGTVPDALYWDTEEPYHYVRLHRFDEAREVLIVGGEDRHTGDDAEAAFRRLEAWARERFPIGAPPWKWSGQVLEPVDALAFIGRAPLESSNVYMVTGDSGHGLTHAAIASLLIPDLIEGRDNPWASLYDPGRLTLRATKDLVVNNLETARHYTEWLVGVPGETADVDEIPAGGGGIVRRHGRPVAVHRTPSGALVERSAVCPHLGGIVHWNQNERSWDCPCHGSRFSARGEVLNGPATRGLESLPAARPATGRAVTDAR
jgi:glycine/D-amino acid oxidase-like deaminating enzyme/nitrite reductase/ring-hydroxylating ferredoxin subunit